jgi:hypothetical protein
MEVPRTPFNLHNVPVGTKGLVAGDVYKTEEGALMIMPEDGQKK